MRSLCPGCYVSFTSFRLGDADKLLMTNVSREQRTKGAWTRSKMWPKLPCGVAVYSFIILNVRQSRLVVSSSHSCISTFHLVSSILMLRNLCAIGSASDVVYLNRLPLFDFIFVYLSSQHFYIDSHRGKSLSNNTNRLSIENGS